MRSFLKKKEWFVVLFLMSTPAVVAVVCCYGTFKHWRVVWCLRQCRRQILSQASDGTFKHWRVVWWLRHWRRHVWVWKGYAQVFFHIFLAGVQYGLCGGRSDTGLTKSKIFWQNWIQLKKLPISVVYAYFLSRLLFWQPWPEPDQAPAGELRRRKQN